MRFAIVAGGVLLALAAAPGAWAAESPAEPAAKPAQAQATPIQAAPKPAGVATLSPYTAVRALQALQDQVAHGSAAAQAAQPKLLAHVADVFAAADAAAWTDSRNANAAALYLFSAGRPSVVRAALEHATLAPESDRLVKGALAYAEGQDDVARALLGTFDPRTLPPGIGGHLALVLATLYADKDPTRAGQMLDAARLLVPGTLVEEAALRRQIFLLAEPALLDRFTALSRQYIRRFHGSVFAGNFKTRLVSFAERVATTGDVAQMAKLDVVLGDLPGAEARTLYLAMAHDAVVAGRSEAARFAAAKATALMPNPAETVRAKLYAAAAIVASDDAAAARVALRALDTGRLSPSDADLRDAALTVASTVDANLGESSPGAIGAAPPPDGSAAALIERATAALTAGDKLLEPQP